jgi:hypothetical protein
MREAIGQVQNGEIMSKRMVILVIVLGCALLAVANISLWATRDVFSSEHFGELVTEGLQSDQASRTLGGLIADQILANKPDLPVIAQVAAGEIAAWVLRRPVLAPVLEKAAATADLILTTSLDDAVSIDLEKAIPFVVGVVTAIDPELADSLGSVRDTGPLKLLGPDELPRLRQAAKIVPWLWPLSAFGAIVLFAAAYWSAQKRSEALVFIGSGVVITGVFQLLFFPAIRLAAENNITDSSVRVIVGEVVRVLLRDFQIQTILLIIIGLVVIGASRLHLKESAQA